MLSFFLVWHTAVLSPGVNDTILTRVFRTHKLFLMRGRNGGGKYYFFGKGGSVLLYIDWVVCLIFFYLFLIVFRYIFIRRFL